MTGRNHATAASHHVISNLGADGGIRTPDPLFTKHPSMSAVLPLQGASVGWEVIGCGSDTSEREGTHARGHFGHRPPS